MSAQLRRCVSDEDYAQFTLFFIRHRTDFDRRFSLSDTIFHILESIHDSHIVLIEDTNSNMIGWGHYKYVTPDYQPDPQGEIAFINSVIITKEYRSSRLFFHGFGELVGQIAEENSHVKQLHFYAQIENAYLNRLYSKFASVIGQHEGYHGTENIYAADFKKLVHYLRKM
ncbi:GNAT family N-acetyltransferase [Aneurinibacillus sp. REN35]|uniref:GNAT family N-acetyltransferase n=1 Tax=Aneurinibacillus sp. REN35 TaxID=3237286 RepID=UPI003527C061